MGILATLLIFGCVAFWVFLILAIVLGMNIICFIIAAVTLAVIFASFTILIYLLDRSERH